MKLLMKSALVCGVAATILFGTTVEAAEKSKVEAEIINEDEQKFGDENAVEPGMAPDHLLYFLDRFTEKVQLAFTRDDEKEANLLMDFAKERLAESDKMADAEKDQYITDLIDAYVANLEAAEEHVALVVMDDAKDQVSKEQLTDTLEKVITMETSSKVDDVIDEAKKQELVEKKQDAYLLANSLRDLEQEQVKMLREQGFGFGEIVKVVVFAKEGNKTEAEIVAMLKEENKGFGEIANELQINHADLLKNIMRKKEKFVEKAIEEAEESGNVEAVNELAKSLERIQKEQIALSMAKEFGDVEQRVNKKLQRIKEKVAAGQMSQEVADRKIKQIQQQVEKKMDKFHKEAKEDADEIAEALEESKEEALEEQQEQAKKAEKVEKKAQEKLEKEQTKQQEKEKKLQQKEEEQAEKVAEKAKEEQEKAAEKAKKEQEKAAEKAKEEQEKAAEKAKKEQEKAAEKAKKEQEKAAEKAKKEQEKAVEKAKKEQEKAAEKEQRNDEEDEGEDD